MTAWRSKEEDQEDQEWQEESGKRRRRNQLTDITAKNNTMIFDLHVIMFFYLYFLLYHDSPILHLPRVITICMGKDIQKRREVVFFMFLPVLFLYSCINL